MGSEQKVVAWIIPAHPRSIPLELERERGNIRLDITRNNVDNDIVQWLKPATAATVYSLKSGGMETHHLSLMGLLAREKNGSMLIGVYSKLGDYSDE
jgi:hypothetical protein